MTKITTGADLNRVLKAACDQMVIEAVKKLREAPVEPKKGQALLLDDPDEESHDISADDATGHEKDSRTMETGDVDTDSVIEKLNTIRSGRSFRDSAVKGSLKKYIDDLKVAERTALFAFLKGIAQITTGEVEPQTATEPSEPAPAVTMKKKQKSTGKKTYTKKPIVTHKPSQPKKKSPPAEDTTAPATPITPKK